jgi:hypothetical protein
VLLILLIAPYHFSRFLKFKILLLASHIFLSHCSCFCIFVLYSQLIVTRLRFRTSVYKCNSVYLGRRLKGNAVDSLFFFSRPLNRMDLIQMRVPQQLSNQTLQMTSSGKGFNEHLVQCDIFSIDRVKVKCCTENVLKSMRGNFSVRYRKEISW